MTYPTKTAKPATDKQKAFLASLIAERTEISAEFVKRVQEAIHGHRPMTAKQASDTITWLMAKPKAPKPTGPALDKGIYVSLTDSGIFKVYTMKSGRLGVKRLEIQDTHSGFAGRFEYVKGGYGRLAAEVAKGTAAKMTAAEASAFGKQYGICCNCVSPLSEDRSIAAGYGPVCAKHHGWHYPSKEEAAEILGMPV